MVKKGSSGLPLIALVFSVLLTGFAAIILQISVSKNLPCANTKSCKESLQLSINNEEKAVFEGKTIDAPKIDLTKVTEESPVLGSEVPEETPTPTSPKVKHIYVDLTTQTLRAYEGENLFMETKVSTGKWFPTPTGDFKIWRKVRSTKMSGGEGADYYYLPNVPYNMFFYNSQVSQGRGFALHGAYWHDNFGHPMSHGCVNMRIIDAKKLYEWVDPPTTDKQLSSKAGLLGTVITIYGKAP
jgi:lipoprotein-anchoring transpeptidase ErfK/SrfK